MSDDRRTRALEAEARAQLQAGDLEGAYASARSLIGELHEPAARYEEWVRLLATLATRMERAAVAGPAWEYLLEWPRATEAYQRAQDPSSAARCLRASGEMIEAASLWEGVGAHAHAAVAWEEAGRPEAAVAAWERSVRRYRAPADRYERGLSLMNLGLALHGLARPAWRARLSEAMVLLSEEADEAERAARQDRALACFYALVEMGRRTGVHENLAEGYLNCIRLMREREQRLFALQYYHDFAQASLEMGEPQAAAEVLREASAYCRRRGLLYGGGFLLRAASAFEEAARAHQAAGAPVELAENALLAALDAYNRAGDERSVLATYRALAELPLPPNRHERYAALAAEVRAERGPSDAWPFRGYFSKEAAYPATWRTDLLRRETGRDLLGPLCAAVGSLRLWDVVRRRALLIVLEAREDEGWETRTARLETLALDLGRLGAPVALGPLRQLFTRGPVSVRRSVAAALRFLPFRESLDLLGACLDEPGDDVREVALTSLRYLVFPGALAPLLRLYRRHGDASIRREVLLAIGRTAGLSHASAVDAMDFLLHVLREGAEPELGEAVRTAIAANALGTHLPLLERHARAEPPGPVRTFLDRTIVRVSTREMTLAMGV